MTNSRRCKVCGESHLLRANGLMSIHTDRNGKRCEEPESRRARESDERRAKEREMAKRLGLDGRKPKPARAGKSEKDAAHEYAAEQKRHKRDPQKRDRFDRSIYAVGRPTIYRGGAPGSKR